MTLAIPRPPSPKSLPTKPVTIRARLLLLVLAALLPALVAMGWAVSSAYVAELQVRERSLRDLTSSLAIVVEREWAQRAAIARVLSLSRELDSGPELTPLQLSEFEQHARRAMDGLKGWVELRSMTGLLMTTQWPAGQTPPPVALSPSAPLVHAPMVLGLMRGPSGGALRATLQVPVVRNGVTVLNLGVTILPQELQAIVDRHRVRIDGAAIIVDRERAVVARYPTGSVTIGQRLGGELWSQLGEQNEAMLQTEGLDGSPTLSHVQRQANGWTVVSEAPQPHWAQLPGAVGQVALGTGLLLALAAGGALWVSRQIAVAVHRLRDAAQRLEHGKSVVAMPTGLTECDQVAVAMAHAGDSMRTANVALQRQVDAAVQHTRRAQQTLANGQRIEALGRLTGGVAHDFNNLLGVISNSAYLIRRHAVDKPEIQSSVQATLRAVQAGSRLSTQLLRFAGRQPVRPKPIDLKVYLPDVSELLRTVLGARVTLQTSVMPDTCALVADAAELELALTNLALSARESMPKGGVLEITASNFEIARDDCAPATNPSRNPAPQGERFAAPRSKCVQIVVTDNGKGFTDEQINHLFEPFSTRSGLTLAQVRGFCVQTGGHVKADSTLGLGTTITMVLPADVTRKAGDAISQDDRAQRSECVDNSTDSTDVQGSRVLLVEDNDDVGEITAALLQNLGLHVTRASDATHALRVLAEHAEPFDVVLSDVSMQGAMDGLALARTLRGRWPNLPVVLISGYTADAIDPREFEVLPKPCTPDELLHALQRALHGAKQASTPNA